MKVAKTPRKTIMTTPGTIPTTAKLDGSDSMPLETISAIICRIIRCES